LVYFQTWLTFVLLKRNNDNLCLLILITNNRLVFLQSLRIFMLDFLLLLQVLAAKDIKDIIFVVFALNFARKILGAFVGSLLDGRLDIWFARVDQGLMRAALGLGLHLHYCTFLRKQILLLAQLRCWRCIVPL
jgi:hypothetical protein